MSISLSLPSGFRHSRTALVSIPWPADRDDIPWTDDVECQVVPLFEPSLPPRLRRYLLLLLADQALPEKIQVHRRRTAPGNAKTFSCASINVLDEQVEDRTRYVYQECELRLGIMGNEFGIRLGLLPSDAAQPAECADDGRLPHCSWWQWVRAERLWNGPVAEAWRIGGPIVPYLTGRDGGWGSTPLQKMAEAIEKQCGDSLHGDLFAIVWRNGCVQLTSHFKSGYLHAWPKPIPAFPVIALTDFPGPWKSQAIAGPEAYLRSDEGWAVDFRSCQTMFTPEAPGRLHGGTDALIFQPWSDLRVLANKDKDNDLTYLENGDPLRMPQGVSRSVWLNLGVDGADTETARYQVPPEWYAKCGEIESAASGPATAMAGRSVDLIKEHTLRGGFDTGFVWRYLRRDVRSGIPQEDGAEWEGDLAFALWQLAYQTGAAPEQDWELFLHHAYHAADIAIYHGSWMERLEASSTFTAPLPKARVSGILSAYLETGDPYLLEVARSVIHVYLAMESAAQPRACMGRDTYPIVSLLRYWDYTADSGLLDFARLTMQRLLATQAADGGFSGQAGVGTFSGVSCLPAKESISFGSGLLAPLTLMEWARRDDRWPLDFREHLQRWVDLMVRLQPADGIWKNNPGPQGLPYTLIGSGAMFSLKAAGAILGDPRAAESVARYLEAMSESGDCVNGTHSFLSAAYANYADALAGAEDDSLKEKKNIPTANLQPSPAGTM